VLGKHRVNTMNVKPSIYGQEGTQPCRQVGLERCRLAAESGKPTKRLELLTCSLRVRDARLNIPAYYMLSIGQYWRRLRTGCVGSKVAGLRGLLFALEPTERPNILKVNAPRRPQHPPQLHQPRRHHVQVVAIVEKVLVHGRRLSVADQSGARSRPSNLGVGSS